MSTEAILAALVEPAGADTDDTSTSLLDTEIAPRCARLSTRDAGGLYARWRTHPAAGQRWTEPAWGTPDDERLLADLRAVEFWALDAGTARLAALAGAADALREAVDRVGGSLHDAWHDGAATAAAGRFGRYAAGVRTWQDGLVQLAVGLDGARTAVADVLRAWADDIGDTAEPKVDDLATRQSQVDRVDDALGRGTLWGRTFVPDELRAQGVCDLNARGAPAWPSHDVLAWLDGFGTRYDAAVGRFRAGLRAAHEAAGHAWQTLSDLAGEVDPDPFAPVTGSAEPVDGERVVIREDGRTMTLAGPDEHGRYSLTVDDGSGPRTHILDLADGQAVVEDGAARITAEQVGPGQVRVSVDDGTGPPTVYTVESVDAPPEPAKPMDGAKSGVSAADTGGGSSAAGSGGGGGPSGPPSTAAPTPLAEGPTAGAEEPGDGRRPVATGAGGGGGPAGGQGGGMGGGGMMGGMGGGGGQGGGDSERKAGQWRLQGSLFDETDPAAHFSGVIGADPGESARERS